MPKNSLNLKIAFFFIVFFLYSYYFLLFLEKREIVLNFLRIYAERILIS